MRNRLAELRAERSISQESLGRDLGVSRQTINSIERGRFDPSLPLAMRLARYFDLQLEKIFLLDE